MEPARFGAYEFRDCSSKGYHVVADFGFDFADALQSEIGQLANGFGCLLGDDFRFRQSFTCGDLDLEPGAEAVFFAPDAGHLRTRVAWNQMCTPQREELGILNEKSTLHSALRAQRSAKNKNAADHADAHGYFSKKKSAKIRVIGGAF